MTDNMEKNLDMLMKTVSDKKPLAQFIKPYLDKSTNMYFRLFYNYLKQEEKYSTLFTLLVKKIVKESKKDEHLLLAISMMLKKYV